jgi:Flp pilus assembly CpaF family ATPase
LPSRRSCSRTSATTCSGYGPLEPLLARDDIADIMVNGAHTTYIEVGGKGAEDDRCALPTTPS